MATHPIQLDEATFEEFVASSDRPVLVDFWADWCQPCLAMAPVIDQLADEYSEKLCVAKLDVETSPDIAARYSVVAIPTLVVFNEGVAVERLRGARSRDALVAELSDYL